MIEKETQISVLRKEMGSMRGSQRALTDKYNTLQSSLSRTEVPGSGPGSGSVRSSSSSTAVPVSTAVVEDLVDQIEKLKQQIEEAKMRAKADKVDENVESEAFQPAGNFFNSRGTGDDVPEYLRYDGPLRNWHLSKRECERAVNDVWIAKEEWQGDQEDEESNIHLSDFIYIYCLEK